MATFVFGSSNPDVDIPAVQAAVNLGGDVVLEGLFSFNSPPTIPTALAGYPNATILVSKAVTISGATKATIEGGTIPFYVDAPGASVTIQELQLIGPTAKGIVVYAANGLTITNCRIQNVGPLPSLGSSAIDIDTSGGVPTLANPGQPQNIFGTVSVTNNEIDLSGGTLSDITLGITVFSVGQLPDNEVDIYIVGNKITNTTQSAINIRHIGGRAFVVANTIFTGSVSGPSSPPEVIRVANDGSYYIGHNAIQCEWPDPQAVGIGVFSQIASWQMDHAVVIGNSVTMSPLQDVTFTGLSAGIDIRGFADWNVVAYNSFKGQARAALALDPFKGGTPAYNQLNHNNVEAFEASIADIVIGLHVRHTVLHWQEGTVQDNGVNTVILP